MENQQNIPEDEIDLREYINVVIKRKRFILTIFFIVIILTAIINLSAPKVYEITSTVQLGNINGMVISKEEAKAIVLNQDVLQSLNKELNLNIDLDNFKRNIKIIDLAGTNLLTLKITYPGLDTAFKINDAILNFLVAQGKIVYQNRLAITNERLKELDDEIKNAEADINRTQKMLLGLPNAGDISQADASLRIILLQNTLPNYESNLTTLRNQKNELKLSLNNAKDFKIFEQPSRPRHPVAPKITKNVIIAGIFSLIIGVFLAFLGEFLSGKERYTK